MGIRIMNSVRYFLFISIVIFAGCYDVKNAVGKRPSEIIEILGPPEYEITFFLSDSTLLEHRYDLKHIFPNYLNKKEHIEIKEIGWKRSTFNKTVVWFHHKNGEWIAVSTLEWNPTYTQF